MLAKNLEVARKILSLAHSVEQELTEQLVGDALENIVSAFDGFGREICTTRGVDVSFQNLAGARSRLQESLGIDLAVGITTDHWETALRLFQKRHLLSQRMGVVDEEYIKKTNDPSGHRRT